MEEQLIIHDLLSLKAIVEEQKNNWRQLCIAIFLKGELLANEKRQKSTLTRLDVRVMCAGLQTIESNM